MLAVGSKRTRDRVCSLAAAYMLAAGSAVSVHSVDRLRTRSLLSNSTEAIHRAFPPPPPPPKSHSQEGWRPKLECIRLLAPEIARDLHLVKVTTSPEPPGHAAGSLYMRSLTDSFSRPGVIACKLECIAAAASLLACLPAQSHCAQEARTRVLLFIHTFQARNRQEGNRTA